MVGTGCGPSMSPAELFFSYDGQRLLTAEQALHEIEAEQRERDDAAS